MSIRLGRILAVDAETGEPTAQYVYVLEQADEFDPAVEPGDQNEMKLSGLIWLEETTLAVLARTDEVARLYTVDLSAATDILGSDWDDANTSPTLEAETAPPAAGVDPLPKALLADLVAIPGMPDKIEDATDPRRQLDRGHQRHDVDIGTFDADGRHQGDGTPSQLLISRRSWRARPGRRSRRPAPRRSERAVDRWPSQPAPHRRTARA